MWDAKGLDTLNSLMSFNYYNCHNLYLCSMDFILFIKALSRSWNWQWILGLQLTERRLSCRSQPLFSLFDIVESLFLKLHDYTNITSIYAKVALFIIAITYKKLDIMSFLAMATIIHMRAADIIILTFRTNIIVVSSGLQTVKYSSCY